MLSAALSTVLDLLSRDALRGLHLTPIEPDVLAGELGRIGTFVQPSYLPLTRDSDELIALYLRPDTPLLSAPLVRLDADNHDVRFLASSLADARTALCVHMAAYADTADELIAEAQALGHARAALNPLAPDVIEHLRAADFSEIYPWSARAPAGSNALWASPALAHPFAHIPHVSRELDPEGAWPVIESLVPDTSPMPELRALRLRAAVEVGQTDIAVDVRAVLQAEAWRDREPILRGIWHVEGEGLTAWDATLQIAAKTPGALSAPFDRLRKHARLYSGDLDEGADLLMDVGRAFERVGDWNAALNQYRNAAAVAGLAGDFVGQVDRQECFEAIARACDHIQRDSLAAELARTSARAYAAGL